MKTYLFKFDWSDPYPKNSTSRHSAVAVHTATARAIRDWKKKEGRGVKSFTVKVLLLE